MASLHIGLSGYDYPEWQGEAMLYPPEVSKSKFLSAYAAQFNSLETHGTFTKMPSMGTTTKWLKQTGSDFTISPKMYFKVTHSKRLTPESYAMAKEFIDALEPVKAAGKLGPILLQLPHNMKRVDERLEAFLAEFPGVRWAIEFLHESWNCDEVEAILSKFDAAWVKADTEKSEVVHHNRANFSYIRLRQLEYSDAQLADWAKSIRRELESGKDCFVYCRHKDTVEPWKWAFRLRELVG